jgi:hypothetical protein
VRFFFAEAPNFFPLVASRKQLVTHALPCVAEIGRGKPVFVYISGRERGEPCPPAQESLSRTSSTASGQNTRALVQPERLAISEKGDRRPLQHRHREPHPESGRFPQMYGPPPDCKGKAKGRSTDLRKCIRPLCGEWSLLATDELRCVLFLINGTVMEDQLREQAASTPLGTVRSS